MALFEHRLNIYHRCFSDIQLSDSDPEEDDDVQIIFEVSEVESLSTLNVPLQQL